MEWVASTLHTTSERGVSSITTADAHTSAASSQLNWRPRRFKWTRQFRRKTKTGFCACAHHVSNTLYMFSVCVSSLIYPTCNAHAPYYITICGCNIFCYILSQKLRFSNKESYWT